MGRPLSVAPVCSQGGQTARPDVMRGCDAVGEGACGGVQANAWFLWPTGRRKVAGQTTVQWLTATTLYFRIEGVLRTICTNLSKLYEA